MSNDRYFDDYLYSWATGVFIGSIASEHGIRGIPKRPSEPIPPPPSAPAMLPVTMREPPDTGVSTTTGWNDPDWDSNEQTVAGWLCLFVAGLVALALPASFALGWTVVLTIMAYGATATLLMARPIIIRTLTLVLGLIPLVAIATLVISILLFS